MRRRAGFTLLELLISVAVLGLVGGSAIALTLGAYQDKALSDGYVRDVEVLRGAVSAVARDIRMATRVSATESAVELDIAGETVRYALEDGVLRKTEDGVARSAGRRIAHFAVKPSGPAYEIEFELEQRAATASGRARITATATPRAAGGER